MFNIERYIPLRLVLREEFQNYSASRLRADILAGITVAAVALPLALAFGIASGATAASGLVTAIIAGILIGGLSGAGFQISGPTGAMSAVLIVLANRYGLEGVWVAGLLAGIFILLLGIFDLGQIVNFIPTAVIAGFTSGIALIIFIGQLDNLLGVTTPGAENAVVKLLEYQHLNLAEINVTALLIALAVMGIMLVWPKQWNMRVPSSLAGLVLALIATIVLNLNVNQIGAIPQSILLDARMLPQNIPWNQLGDLIAPALSIAALGAIESLLSGTVGARMANARMFSNQELIAQGIGNIVIPFFGGVPATAAIARTSVAIKSGGRTRIVSIVHSVILLLAVLVLAPVLARVPLAALAGVLAITAWRMNDWTEIRDIFSRRFKSAIFAFVTTMIATVALDLTQAIIIGVGLSALIFVFQISRSKVAVHPVSAEKMRQDRYEMLTDSSRIGVVYVVGPLFFGTATTFTEALDDLGSYRDIVLSLRTVPLLDTTGIAAIEQLIERVEARGGKVYLSGLNAPVERYLERAHILAHIGRDNITWSAFEAIIAADTFRATSEKQTPLAAETAS
ncbi:MAG: putative sulfate transporter [Chloroflexi bacterium OLB15]|nr:MAG: putative sulfate transporter [Chloroflexi bacterium OLB15]